MRRRQGHLKARTSSNRAGVAQESLGVTAGAAESYRKYIEIRNDAEGDPLVGDARKRVSR